MTQLHQLLAVRKDRAARAQKELTAFYHKVQKPEPFSGVTRTYTPKDDEGEQLPSEHQRVQYDADDLLHDVKQALVPMYKIVGDIDNTNRHAVADVDYIIR